MVCKAQDYYYELAFWQIHNMSANVATTTTTNSDNKKPYKLDTLIAKYRTFLP
jgi:hypothetical protein